jgi:hypothetical protein
MHSEKIGEGTHGGSIGLLAISDVTMLGESRKTDFLGDGGTELLRFLNKCEKAMTRWYFVVVDYCVVFLVGIQCCSFWGQAQAHLISVS